MAMAWTIFEHVLPDANAMVRACADMFLQGASQSKGLPVRSDSSRGDSPLCNSI